jgi:hypothetical protein
MDPQHREGVGGDLGGRMDAVAAGPRLALWFHGGGHLSSHTPPVDWWLSLALLVLPSWIGAAIPWRSERAGGAALVAVGFFLCTLITLMLLPPAQGLVLLLAPSLVLTYSLALPEVVVLLPLLLFAGFPLVPGTLFLANYWRSRTPTRREATE